MSSLPTAQLWINGAARPSSNGQTFDIINSGSQKVVSHAAKATWDDIELAITEADKTQPGWEDLPVMARRQILVKTAQLLITEKYIKRGAQIVNEEIGAVPEYATWDIQGAAVQLEVAAFESVKLHGRTLPSERVQGGTIVVEKRAHGTVFAIAPFNNPLLLAARAVAIPLMCGNAVVLKSSEMTPRSSEILVEALYEAGLPKGVLNVVHISREDSPQFVADIIKHPLIRHINFTGSDRVGRIIAQEAGKYLKPCVLELGGKSATVVLDDADIEDAARTILYGAVEHGGQICMSTERVIVQKGASKPLIDTITRLAKNVRAGPQPDAHIPPLIASSSAERVLSLINDAKAKGGDVILGDLTRNGAYIKPHIVLGVEPGWKIWHEETFGPVFGIKVVETEEEAIRLANITDYSLMGALFTKDIEKGMRLARRIRAAQININGPTFGYEPTVGVHGLGGGTGYGNFDVENFTQERSMVIIPPDSGKNLRIVKDL